MNPVGVVSMYDTIQGNSHQKMILGQKFRPLLSQAISICLNGIVNRNIFYIILLLILQKPFIKIQTYQGRLSP